MLLTIRMADMRNPTTLTDLPLELLWLISEHLSPVDLACFALGNHGLLHSFAGTALKNFSNRSTGNTAHDARIKLLSRLSRDLPQYHLCFICIRLHLWKNAAPPIWASRHFKHPAHLVDRTTNPDSWYIKKPLRFAGYPSYAFHLFYFVHLQLAMRRFYYGPEFGIPVESLLYTEISSYRLQSKGLPSLQPSVNMSREAEVQNDVLTTIFSVDFRICSMPPGLCMRTQNIAVVTRQNAPRMWPFCGKATMKVCMHIDTGDQSDFRGILASQIERYCSSTSPEVPADQGSCDKCSTSWQLQIQTLDETRASLTFTVWMDLGAGLSMEDPKWKYRLNHSYHVRASFPAENEILDARLRFERDSVEARSSNALSENEMYCRNASLLRGERYKTVMTQVLSGRYIMNGEAEEKKRHSRCIIL